MIAGKRHVVRLDIRGGIPINIVDVTTKEWQSLPPLTVVMPLLLKIQQRSLLMVVKWEQKIGRRILQKMDQEHCNLILNV